MEQLHHQQEEIKIMMTSSSESEKEEESTTSKVSAMANGSQLHVMTSLLSCIREDASAARSRNSAAVTTVSRAVTITATKSQPSPSPSNERHGIYVCCKTIFQLLHQILFYHCLLLFNRQCNHLQLLRLLMIAPLLIAQQQLLKLMEWVMMHHH